MLKDQLFLDVDTAIKRIGDKDIYMEIASAFAEHIPVYLASFSACIDRGDDKEANRVAHSLKSSCATVGAGELSKTMATLEQLAKNNDLKEVARQFSEITRQLLLLKEKLQDLATMNA